MLSVEEDGTFRSTESGVQCGESHVVAVAVAAAAAVTAGLKTAISWQCKRSGC